MMGWRTVVGGVLVGCLVALAWAVPDSNAMGTTPKKTAQVSGTVQSVSRQTPKTPVLTVRTAMGRTVSLRVNPKKVLVMRKGGQKAAWDQVKIGDTLRVDYYEERGKQHATVIRIDPMPATGAAKPATSTPKKK